MKRATYLETVGRRDVTEDVHNWEPMSVEPDFNLAAPRLSCEDQAWLLHQLEKRFTHDHPWVTQLKELMSQRAPVEGQKIVSYSKSKSQPIVLRVSKSS